MALVTIAEWKIDCDPERTREAYASRSSGAPEECACLHCRNFIAARNATYTNDVLNTLAPLGVRPPIREAEIYHTVQLDSGLHLYGGFLHVVGKLVGGEDLWRPVDRDIHAAGFVAINARFSIGITQRLSLVPDAFRDMPLLQLEFSVEVPWVLDEPCD